MPPASSADATPPAKTAGQQHRSPQREVQAQPKFTRRDTAKLVADVVYHMRGCNGQAERMNFRAAIDFVCASWKRAPEAALAAIKFWGYNFDEMEQGP